MAKIGVVGTIGGWSSEKLADTVATTTNSPPLLIDMKNVYLDLPSGNCWYGNLDLLTLDALIIKKIGTRYSTDLLDRLEILRFLASRGVRIFSEPAKIMRVLNRLTCTITLQLAGIPIPRTTITEDLDVALTAIERYGTAVFKPLYTSKARGMLILKKDTATHAVVKDYSVKNPVMYIQEMLEIGDFDLGVVFLGDKYLTTYARCKASDSWNTTTASGGKYIRFDPPHEVIELAQKAQHIFGLDFTCVDIALTTTGPYVFEVSAFGGFRGIQETRNIDAAKCYTDYVLERLAK